jgi:hypothetical protein
LVKILLGCATSFFLDVGSLLLLLGLVLDLPGSSFIDRNAPHAPTILGVIRSHHEVWIGSRLFSTKTNILDILSIGAGTDEVGGLRRSEEQDDAVHKICAAGPSLR